MVINVFTCRAYSRKIERPGIERFTKSALFEKKNFFFSICIKCVKTYSN